MALVLELLGLKVPRILLPHNVISRARQRVSTRAQRLGLSTAGKSCSGERKKAGRASGLITSTCKNRVRLRRAE